MEFGNLKHLTVMLGTRLPLSGLYICRNSRDISVQWGGWQQVHTGSVSWPQRLHCKPADTSRLITLVLQSCAAHGIPAKGWERASDAWLALGVSSAPHGRSPAQHTAPGSAVGSPAERGTSLGCATSQPCSRCPQALHTSGCASYSLWKLLPSEKQGCGRQSLHMRRALLLSAVLESRKKRPPRQAGAICPQSPFHQGTDAGTHPVFMSRGTSHTRTHT